MYVSIAIKLSKYLPGLLCTLYQQLIKVNVKSFMCDALFTQVNKVHAKFAPSALRLKGQSLCPDRHAPHLDRCYLHPDGFGLHPDELNIHNIPFANKNAESISNGYNTNKKNSLHSGNNMNKWYITPIQCFTQFT